MDKEQTIRWLEEAPTKHEAIEKVARILVDIIEGYKYGYCHFRSLSYYDKYVDVHFENTVRGETEYMSLIVPHNIFYPETTIQERHSWCEDWIKLQKELEELQAKREREEYIRLTAEQERKQYEALKAKYEK